MKNNLTINDSRLICALQKPGVMSRLFKKLDKLSELPPDYFIDDLLGLTPFQARGQAKQEERRARELFGDEQYTYEPTPYDFIQFFLKAISPGPNDVIYDLGSGYARIVFYGGLVYPSKFKGIEIVPQRVNEANKIKKTFNIQNIEFMADDVKKSNLSDGTIFFLFNPFLDKTLRVVGDQLKEIGEEKNIWIICWGGFGIYNYFRRQKWLHEVNFHRNPRFNRLSFFQSL